MTSPHWEITTLASAVSGIEYSSFQHQVIEVVKNITTAINNLDQRLLALEGRQQDHQELSLLRSDVTTLQYNLRDVEEKLNKCNWCAPDKLGGYDPSG